MTEQEYCDLSDLQLARAALMILRFMNCFEQPNKARLESAIKSVKLIEEEALNQVPELD